MSKTVEKRDEQPKTELTAKCHGCTIRSEPRSIQNHHTISVRKEIQLLGSWGYTEEDFVRSLELIRSGKVDRKPLVTHEFPLHEAKEAYEMQLKTGEAIKVLLKP